MAKKPVAPKTKTPPAKPGSKPLPPWLKPKK